jgi:hypothetical protein
VTLAGEPAERYQSALEMRRAIQDAARGRDSSSTLALEAAALERRDATAATQAVALPDTEATRVIQRQQQPAQVPVAAPAPARRTQRRAARAERGARPLRPRRRRGRFTRFMAMMFLFLLIVTIVAAVVVINLDTSDSRHFEHVVRDRVQDQIDGIRQLISDATK